MPSPQCLSDRRQDLAEKFGAVASFLVRLDIDSFNSRKRWWAAEALS